MPTTSEILSTIQQATNLLSTPLPRNAYLLQTILALHKQLSHCLQALCVNVITSLKNTATTGHTIITESNKRLSEIHEELDVIHAELSYLRGRRAGLWECVNNALTKLTTFSDGEWSLREFVHSWFSRGVITDNTDKLRTRAEFRDSAKALKEVDNVIRGYDKRLCGLKKEEECLKESIADHCNRVNDIVRSVGTWERVLQRLVCVAVDEVLALVEIFGEREDGVVDATLVVDVPDGVAAGLRGYCERWRSVFEAGGVEVAVEVDGMERILSICEELRKLV